jgi:hypothetical protein
VVVVTCSLMVVLVLVLVLVLGVCASWGICGA